MEPSYSWKPGGREKTRETYGGRKFIASNPRGVHTASRGEIWRVESMVNGGYSTTYEIKFESATVIAVLDEAKVLESVYTNSEVYSRIGKEMCIVIDIAMAKGGTEAIVESFYSSMASQAMHGGQSNETLALRLVAYESGRNKHVNWLKYVRKF